MANKKGASRKFVASCTVIILLAITLAAYFVYDQDHPLKCTTTLGEIDVRVIEKMTNRPQEIICEDDVRTEDYTWTGGNFWFKGRGKCYYKLTTCVRD